MPDILIVDDDFTIINLFKFVFEDNGYEVMTANNGKDAIEKLKSFTPDIMLIDIDMPEMNGDEFIGELKKMDSPDRKFSEIPFIVMTGSNFMSANHPNFRNNPFCKSYVPKMTIPEDILYIAANILKKV